MARPTRGCSGGQAVLQEVPARRACGHGLLPTDGDKVEDFATECFVSRVERHHHRHVIVPNELRESRTSAAGGAEPAE